MPIWDTRATSIQNLQKAPQCNLTDSRDRADLALGPGGGAVLGCIVDDYCSCKNVSGITHKTFWLFQARTTLLVQWGYGI